MRNLTGRNFLIRARTATRYNSFFLRLATCDDQDREGRGRYPVPRDVPLEFAPPVNHPNTAKGQIIHSGKVFVEYQLSCILSFADGQPCHDL